MKPPSWSDLIYALAYGLGIGAITWLGASLFVPPTDALQAAAAIAVIVIVAALKPSSRF